MIWCNVLLARERSDQRFTWVDLRLESSLYALVQACFDAGCDGIYVLLCDHLIVSCLLTSGERCVDSGNIDAPTWPIDITRFHVSRWSTDHGVCWDYCLY